MRLTQKLLFNIKKDKFIFLSIIIIATVVTIVFYFIQNSSKLAGGEIALAKAIWLEYAIVYWYVFPIMIVFDGRTPRIWKLIYIIFLGNMLVRAALELMMIYVWYNWSTVYGISHDIFSMLLLLYIVKLYKIKPHINLFTSYLAVIFMMFILEIIFAVYMSLNMTNAGSLVYFVPGNNKHNEIMFLTWVVNAALTVYLIHFYRRWINEKPC